MLIRLSPGKLTEDVKFKGSRIVAAEQCILMERCENALHHVWDLTWRNALCGTCLAVVYGLCAAASSSGVTSDRKDMGLSEQIQRKGAKVVTELGQLSCEDTERACSAWRRLQSDIRPLPVPKGAVRKQERDCLQRPGIDRGEWP